MYQREQEQLSETKRETLNKELEYIYKVNFNQIEFLIINRLVYFFE